jgi:cell division protein FtsW
MTALTGNRPVGSKPVVNQPSIRRAPQERSAQRRIDMPLTSYYLVLGSSALLVVLGLVMVLSASNVSAYVQYDSSFSIVAKQATWVAIGLPLAWAGSRLPIRAWRQLSYVGLLGAISVLVLVQVPGMGVAINGNQNWLTLPGGFTLQPSEFAKLALVLWGSDLLARKHALINQWRHLLIPLLPVALVVIGLVQVGHDLGTVVIMVVMTASLLWVAGAPGRLFVVLGSITALVVVYFTITHAYRQGRILSWLNPASDPQSAGWQARHGRYALADGGLWGVGLGASRQKWGWLPLADSDFIFAVIGEELGLIGSFVVLGLFGTLTYAGFRIALRTNELFVRLAAAGITAWLAVQAAVNIGAVVGVLPITGLPLPFVSVGGSAMIASMCGVGLLLAFARAESGAAAALAARRGWLRSTVRDLAVSSRRTSRARRTSTVHSRWRRSGER